MAPTLNQNQFAQIPVLGMMDAKRSQNTLSCEVDSSSAQSGGLKVGQPVKLVDSSGGVPKVVELASATDIVFGFIIYDIKDASFPPLAAVEVMTGFDDVMYMVALGAISRGAILKVDPGNFTSTPQVTTNVTGSGIPIIGWALDKAVNAGDLIRVSSALPAYFKS
jgi:hypothetical protein